MESHFGSTIQMSEKLIVTRTHAIHQRVSQIRLHLQSFTERLRHILKFAEATLAEAAVF